MLGWWWGEWEEDGTMDRRVRLGSGHYVIGLVYFKSFPDLHEFIQNL